MATVSFDGPNKCIDIVFGAGESAFSLDVKYYYSRWKDWMLVGTNSKYLQAMSSAGGDPLGGTQYLGAAFFLENGWAYCPFPYAGINHTVLTLVGDVFPRTSGTPIIDYTDVPVGQNLFVYNQTSSLPTLQIVTTSGISPTQQQIRDAMTLAPTSGPSANSVDDKLNTIKSATNLIPALV